MPIRWQNTLRWMRLKIAEARAPRARTRMAVRKCPKTLSASTIFNVSMKAKPLAHPLDSGFAFMLTLKIVLALSVFGHFLTAMRVRARGARASAIFKRIHLSVFCHLIGIIVLAKLMFHLRW